MKPIVPLRALFDCLGVYHDILAGDSCETVWKRVEAALQHKPIEPKVLLELRGCDFPSEFQFLNCRVVKMSADKWLTLCSRGDELSARHGRSIEVHGKGRWYLELTETDDVTLVSHLRVGEPRAKLRGWKRENKRDQAATISLVKASHRITTRAFGLDSRGRILDHFWLQLLVLALCHSGNFDTGEVLYSIPGAGVTVLTDRHLIETLEGEPYEIPESDWLEFQQFLKLISNALLEVIRSHSIETLWEVARQYMRGRLMECEVTPDEWSDEYDDLVLCYVIALEKLVVLPDKNENGSYQLIERTAHLVGRNDEEVRLVADFIKRAYEERNGIVHRRRMEDGQGLTELRRLRDICRRAIACALILAGKSDKKNYLNDFLRQLLISGDPQKRAQREEAQQLAQETAIQIGSPTECLWIGDESTT